MNKNKIVFIGGLTNGVVVYEYLKKNKYADLVLVITYPDHHNAPRMIEFEDERYIIKTTEANSQIEAIKLAQPDYIIVAGWSEFLSKELINIPVKGTIGFHPSKLPYNKGRSVIAWQIEEGYKEIALTMFYYNNIPDGGDIIAQEMIVIEENDYCNDVLDKIDNATYNLMYAYFPLIRLGKAPRIKQKTDEGNFRRLRKNRDSIINWNQNSGNIYNKIRAISKPYPGTETILNGKKIIVWKGEIVEFPFGENEKSGTMIATLYDNSIIMKTKNGFIRITEYDIQ